MLARPIFTIMYCWSLFIYILPLSESCASELFTVSKFNVISSSIISLTLQTSSLDHGNLVPYLYDSNDSFDIDENGNIWLIRQDVRMGVIVGSGKDMLYEIAADPQVLPSATKLDARLAYKLISTNDANYRQSRVVTKVGRKSRPIDSTWTNMGLQVQMEHHVYVKLPYPLQEGKAYTLSLPLVVDSGSIDFVYDERTLYSEAIHISQLGYQLEAPQKNGYLSLWAGSLGAITFEAGKGFQVIDETTGEVAYSGQIQLKKAKTERDEDAFNKNYTLADVYLLDFSTLNREGTYFVWVEGVGRSESFTMKSDVWGQLLNDAIKGLYVQRCGINLGAPFGVYERARCHHPDEGTTTLTSEARLMDTGNGFIEGLDNFSLLVELATDIPLQNSWGGYHDAGDWDRRVQHLEVTRNLLDLYQQFPNYFRDMSLNIPESTNDIPDIIDESLWSLDFFCRLQGEDGAVRGGIESDGHPYFGEPSWRDRRLLLAYHPGIWSTYLFAASAARAARVIAPMNPEKAADYRQRAIRAMQWAEEAYSQQPEQQPYQVNDSRNLAAVELYALTDDILWHDLFIATSALINPGTLLYVYENHDQAEAAWAYLQIPVEKSNQDLRDNCTQAIYASADFMLNAQTKAGFGWLKYPWSPPFAGAFTLPYARDIIWAWLLSDEQRYLGSVEMAMQSVHGMNPLNISYTTGAGNHSVNHIMHPDSRIAGYSAPAGITALGPLDIAMIGEERDAIVGNYGQYCYPSINKWPVLETFLDVFWIPLMDEFTIKTMATQVYTLGFLAAHHTR